MYTFLNAIRLVADAVKKKLARLRNRKLVLGTAAISLAVLSCLGLSVQAQTAYSLDAQVPGTAPKYFRPTYHSALSAPRPSQKQGDNVSAIFNSATYPNLFGMGGIYQQGGAVTTSSNAFFQALGTNGRSCASCHKPESGMGVSAAQVQALFIATGGKDPIFAPVDGSNCPSNVPAANTSAAALGGRLGGGHSSFIGSHSLILSKGLFRVFLPVPKQTNDLSSVGMPPHATEFTISVVSDPNGCNTDPAYSTYTDPVTQEVSQIVSVYRRPRIASNLHSALTPALTLGFGFFPNNDNVTGAPVVDPASGLPISGNIMWDGREPTLQSQAIDATLTHAQALSAPTLAQVAQIVGFEMNTFAAQSSSYIGGDLTGADGSGVAGGPQNMVNQPLTFGPFADYDRWNAPVNTSASFKSQMRASIARGQALFNTFAFQTSNVAGFNNGGVMTAAPEPSTCSTCHIAQSGGAILPRNQMDIGTGGSAVLFGGPSPSKDLPIFKVSCTKPYTTPFGGSVIYTNDPGMALITGRCADIGRKSVPQVRAMASRAPYFSDGSAATTRDVVEFYNKRFSINFTEQQKIDLVNFLNAL